MVIAAALTASRIRAALPANDAPSQAGFFITSGLLISIFVAFAAPLWFSGPARADGKHSWLAALPLSPLARVAGPACAGAAAAFAVFCLFCAAEGAIWGASAIHVTERRNFARFTGGPIGPMRAPGDSLTIKCNISPGELLNLSPRIGYAIGYGDPNPVNFSIRRTDLTSGAETTFTIRSRARHSLALDGAGNAEFKITRMSEGPVAFWPENSIWTSSPPLRSDELLLIYLPPILLVYLTFSAFSIFTSSFLSRPFAIAACLAFFFSAFLAPPVRARNALGIERILDIQGWWTGDHAAPGALEFLHVASLILILIILSALRFRRVRS